MSDARIWFDENEFPPELLREIVSHFQTRDFIALGAIDKRFHTLFGDKRKLACELAHKLHTHVIRGEKDEAEDLIKQYPSLLTVKGRVIDFSGCVIEGTALGMALGAEDVSTESKCHLLVIQPPSPADLGNATLPDYLLDLIIIPSACYVRCDNKLFYIDKANHKCIDIQLDEAIIIQFDAEMLPQFPAQALSKEQLKNITFLTSHDHTEEMAEMMMRYLRQRPDGEKMIAKQISEQFPEGWEFEEEQRVMRDSDVLNSVLELIDKTPEEDIKKCEKYVNTFQTYLDFENKGKGVKKTGKHFNPQLLIEALILYVQYFYRFGGRWDSPKNLLFWQKIIGYIERYLPANCAQAFCTGLGNMVDERLRRSLKLRNYDTNQDINFFPLDVDPKSRLGSHFAVYSYRAGGGGLRWLVCVEIARITKLCQAKSINGAKIYAAARQLLRDSPHRDVAFFSTPAAITTGESSQHEFTKHSSNSL